MTAKWHDANLTLSAPAKWVCSEEHECEACGRGNDVSGGNGGERTGTNARRARADAKAHTEETGHTTTVYTLVGFYEGKG
jgi:hypothetical protein